MLAANEQPFEAEVATVATVVSTPSSKTNGTKWLSLISVIVFIIVLCVVLFYPSEEGNEKGANIVDRQGYYNYLIQTYTPLIGTPQDEAIEWLAFQDEPLSGADLSRLDQRYALAVLYYAHGGSSTWNSINHDSLGGWITNGAGVDECEWKGVDCNSFQQVTGLRLSASEGVKLTGFQLSSEIGLLSNLQSLDFSNQRLQGSIPSEWKILSNLMILDLSNNQIGSSIPDIFGALDQLQSLLLGGNLLVGSIPNSLEDSNIERLEVQHNLGLEGRLEGLLTNMPNLTYLDVSSTSVSGFLPATEIPKLRQLYAPGSLVTGTIPSEIGTWSSLHTFNIGQSQISGTIPSELGLLGSTLKALKLSNLLSMNGTLPSELSTLESLTSLELRASSFTGTLPSEYSQLTNLITFDLAYNSGINGTVPGEYGQMESLKNFYVHGTSLSGTIDPDICSLHLVHFTADCTNRRVEVDCNCCTQCFNLP